MPHTYEVRTATGIAPIARITGQTAAEAALATLSEDVARARAEGRLVQALPLDAVDEAHLVRDRLAVDPEEAATLEQSLRERGQQVPIDVVDLGQGASPRYGLISGWRRLTALRRLAATDDRFATVLAVLRRPETAAESYRAMVEENEIRVGLGYYERARIVARAAGQGVFRDEAEALAELFSAASRSKRSKIGSFLKVHEALDSQLRFPSAIAERQGLALAKALEDRGFAERLRDRLRKTPAETAAEESAAIDRALAGEAGPKPAPEPAPELLPGVRLTAGRGRLVLSGPGVDEGLRSRLEAWLAGQGSG